MNVFVTSREVPQSQCEIRNLPITHVNWAPGEADGSTAIETATVLYESGGYAGPDMSPEAELGRRVLADNYPAARTSIQRLAWSGDHIVNHFGPTRSQSEILHETAVRVLQNPQRLANLRGPVGFIYWKARRTADEMSRLVQRRGTLATFIEPTMQDGSQEEDDGTDFVNGFITLSCPMHEEMRARDMLEGILKHVAEYEACGCQQVKDAEVFRRRTLGGESPDALASEYGVTRGTIHAMIKRVRDFLRQRRHMLA